MTSTPWKANSNGIGDLKQKCPPLGGGGGGGVRIFSGTTHLALIEAHDQNLQNYPTEMEYLSNLKL